MVSVRQELKEHALKPRKRWGQHFLVDRNVLGKVIRTAQVRPEDVVLEVGPGLGEMTEHLACLARRVIAVEIDPKLVAILGRKMEAHPNLELIQKDILEVDFETLLGREDRRVKVVANLPYQISTPLIFRFIDSKKLFSTLTLTLQREVADRMGARPGGKDYGPLTVLIQSFADPSIRFYIKPTAFFPPPRVESAVISVTWKERPIVASGEEAWFKSVVRGCMGYRRKTLINALKHSALSLPADVEHRVGRVGIDPRRRPGTLTPEEFATLARALS